MIAGALRALCLALVATGGGLIGWRGACAQEAGRIALVIGNAAYEAPGWELSTPTEDAALIAQALESAGFEVDLALDADNTAMSEALSRFGERIRAAGPSAVGVFYFAGQAARSRGYTHLLPVDARAQREADIRGEAPRLDLLASAMDPLGAGRAFIVIDACRPTPLAADSPQTYACAPGRAEEAHGRLVAYAAGPEEMVGAADSSVYARALASALGARGLSAEDMFIQAAARVTAATGGRQHPRLAPGERGEPVYLAGAPTRDDYETRVAESLRWDFARRTGTPEAYQAYLAAHPKGRFVAAALARLAATHAAPTTTALAEAASEEPAASAPDAGAAASALAAVSIAASPTESADADYRRLDGEDVLLLETTKGLIVVEMLPELAPELVARVRELAREGYYDGVPFHRVIDGFLAETVLRPAPDESPPIDALPRAFLSAAPIKPTTVQVADSDRNRIGVYAGAHVDFGIYKGVPVAVHETEGRVDTWATHCPGVVSTGRDPTADPTLFIMRGEAPGLDGSAQPWGRVIAGLEVVYDLAVGDPLAPGYEPDRILTMEVASDVAAGQSVDDAGGSRSAVAQLDSISVLDETSHGFDALIASLGETLGRAPRICEVRLPESLPLALATPAGAPRQP